MTYRDIKIKIEENKQKIVLVICFILVFVIGFGTGRYNKDSTSPRAKTQTQVNYTTKPAVQPTEQAEGEGAGDKQAASKTPVPAATTAVLGAGTDKSCAVKGNASSKIYHVAGGAFYSTLKSPHCFGTEGEALAAGYRKSSR